MATRFGQTLDDVLYAAIDVNKTGMLKVSDVHTVYWEESGNAEGLPVMVLHGGPGGGSQAEYRRYFDPSKYRIVQMDQRERERDLSAKRVQNEVSNFVTSFYPEEFLVLD